VWVDRGRRGWRVGSPVLRAQAAESTFHPLLSRSDALVRGQAALALHVMLLSLSPSFLCFFVAFHEVYDLRHATHMAYCAESDRLEGHL
jgi:hypothetical protein